ncbi:MAG TPA: rhomboid family intramembrane serine protease [Vicinamibacterales bacterium]|nr:rhomboid family intramembrane serine protease [Vicinamibacterales bacterium]
MPRSPRLSTVAYSFGPGPVTPAVRMLLWANIGMYVASLIFPVIVDWLGLVPKQVIEARWLWQPVTYMFLHARNPTHILFNMLILWMFGVELERMWRTRFFVKYYFVTGVGAALLSVVIALLPFGATHATYDVTIIGASGALYGLLLAYALYFPDRPILMFLFFPVPAKYFVMILGAIAFLTSIEGGGTVAATTHLSGLVVGYLYLQGGRGGFGAEIKYRYLKWKMNRMRRKFDIYSGGRSEKARWDRNVH